MIAILYIIGVISIIVGIVLGVDTGSFLGFVAATLGGIIVSVIWFCLAVIVDNQNSIQIKLQEIENQLKKPPAKITCTKCAKGYDDNISYCPHCAFKPY